MLLFCIYKIFMNNFLHKRINEIIKKNQKMVAMGFEPTPLTRSETQSDALVHSAKQPSYNISLNNK